MDKGVAAASDRYCFSSCACHSVDMDWAIGANSLSAELLRLTVTVFLDVPEAAQRIWKVVAPVFSQCAQNTEEIFGRF